MLRMYTSCVDVYIERLCASDQKWPVCDKSRIGAVITHLLTSAAADFVLRLPKMASTELFRSSYGSPCDLEDGSLGNKDQRNKLLINAYIKIPFGLYQINFDPSSASLCPSSVFPLALIYGANRLRLVLRSQCPSLSLEPFVAFVDMRLLAQLWQRPTIDLTVSVLPMTEKLLQICINVCAADEFSAEIPAKSRCVIAGHKSAKDGEMNADRRQCGDEIANVVWSRKRRRLEIEYCGGKQVLRKLEK